MITVNINGKNFEAQEGETILELSKRNGYHIPTLCHLNLHDMNYCNHPVSCRICMVEVEDARGKRLVPSCDTFVADGLKVSTDSKRAITTRRTVLELMLSNHPQDCLYCDRNSKCELQDLASEFNMRKNRFEGKTSNFGVDMTSKSIVKDLDKCILCRRCETICREVQTVDIYSAVGRGFDTVIAPAFNDSLQDTPCTFCGQCVSVCPTAALSEVNQIDKLWDALANDDKVVIVQTAPAVRVAVAEEFGAEPGTVSTGKMVTALKRLGFDQVFDTNWAADITIMEEATEILSRLNGNGRLPILTSCCPAWIKFIEHQFPNLIDIPSTCKSPHEMFGALAKSYYAQKIGVDPSKIVVVSVMPCVAKKYESARPELGNDQLSDVDIVITTREFAHMVKEAGINYMDLDDCEFDNPMGESTGAAQIFGTTGGVLEAALRTVADWLGESNGVALEFKGIRGLAGVKEATVSVAGRDIKVAAAHGLGEARKVLEMVESGDIHYDIIEIMACPGGCIAGGGQPFNKGDRDVISKRMESMYNIDDSSKIRMSHKNPDVIKIYEDFIGEPGGKVAHELLHTHFVERKIVKEEE